MEEDKDAYFYTSRMTSARTFAMSKGISHVDFEQALRDIADLEDHDDNDAANLVLKAAIAKHVSGPSAPMAPKGPTGAPSAGSSTKREPEPQRYRATYRVHASKFNPKFLPQEVIYEMMRNQLVPVPKNSLVTVQIEKRVLDWCEANCADLWMPSPPDKPEYILFASASDLTMALMAF